MATTKKLGFTFHRSFKLQRAPISMILNYLDDKSKNLSKKNLIEELNFGSIYAEAYPRYAIATGFIDPTLKKLSLLGKFIVKNDPLLNIQATKWLMHYKISNSEGFGPVFWGYLVREFFKQKMIFTTSILRKSLINFNLTFSNNNFNHRVINTTISVFLNSYLSNDGLGSLDILAQSNEEYLITSLGLHDEMVFGYAICDYFFSKPDVESIDYEIISKSELKNIFLLSNNSIDNFFGSLVFHEFFDIKRNKVVIKYPINIIKIHLLNAIYRNKDNF